MSLFDDKVSLGFSVLQRTAGDVREFIMADGQGGVEKFSIRCVWARDTMKTSPVATAVGVYFADIFCTFSEADLIADEIRLPQEGEFVESPAFVKYEVVALERGSGIVTLSLVRKTFPR